MARLTQFPEKLKSCRKQLEIFDDFEGLIGLSPAIMVGEVLGVSAISGVWSVIAPDNGQAIITDAAGGVLTVNPSDVTVADNDEVYLRTTYELFKFANDKPAFFETRLQYTEAATDDANVCVGFMSAVGPDSILDGGGGPKASYSGAVVFKVDGGTVWNCESSLAGTQTTTASVDTAGGSAYQTIGIQFQPISSTLGEVTFTLDGAAFLDVNRRPIKHQITYTSATEMSAFVGVKNGGSSNETVLFDYIYASQVR